MLALVSLLVACAPTGPQVVVSREPPPRGCVPRGGVIELSASSEDEPRYALYGEMAGEARERRANFIYVEAVDTETDYFGTFIQMLLDKRWSGGVMKTATGEGYA